MTTDVAEESRPRGLGTLGWGCIGAAIAACLIGQPSVNDWLERRSEAARMAEMHFTPVVSSTGPIKNMVNPVATGPDAPPLAPYTPEAPSLPPLQLGSRKGTPGISFTSSYNITYDDIAVAVVTSSATIDKRLPILHEAWVGTVPFPVLILTDGAPVANKSFNASALTSDMVRVHTTNCSASLNGLVCKTKLAFQELYEAYPNKKWYLRLMDDTLVVAPNLLRMLQKVDPDKSWAVGDKIPIENANFSYFQGGGGWGLSAPALSVVREHWDVWDQVVMSGGDSPAAPGFTSLAAYSDDLLWGIFMANLAIPSIKLQGWSGAPLDMLGGILPCDQEISKNFCFSQTFVVGLWADGREVKSAGTCRSKMEAPGVVHMGLEIWGGKDPWFEQMVELSRAIAESPSDLVGRFEDAPYFYWRLCSKSGRSIRTMSLEQTYREIYKQTMAKTRFEQVIDAGAHHHILSIGLCQEPRDVIALLPEPAQKDPNVGGVLVNAFDRHRDRLRFHTRPWVFTLVAQSPTGDRANRSMQMVYRIGDDSYAIARSTCRALNMSGEPSCLQYAVDQLHSHLPPELHYHNLCQKHQLTKVDPGQYVIREAATGAVIDRPTPPPDSDDDDHHEGASGPQRRRSPSAPYTLMPVASLVQQAQKEFSEKHGWQRFSVSAADVAIAVLTTSKQLPTRLPSLLKAWMDDSPFDSIVVTDGPPPKTVRGKPMDPRVVHVDCPAGVEGMVCKTAESLELLWARYPSKKWYLRVTDTAVIIPDNLLYHLRFTDPDQPWVLGDELEVELNGQRLSYLHGGPGWALSSAALKAVLPHLDSYRGLVNAGERVKLGLDLKPLHDNLDDFYFGYMLKRAGVPLKRGEGWTAAPVDALTASQSCSKLLRTSLVSRQAFHIGTTSTGMPVAGQTPVHVTLYRPAVLNAARVAESYAQEPHWLSSPPHLTLLHALRSGSLDVGSLAAGFDDNPYYYWRLCTMGSDGADVAEPEDDVIEAIARTAGKLEKGSEAFTLGEHQLDVGVHLCGMPWDAALPLCAKHQLDDKQCELVALFVETKRDELRQRFPPLRLLMGMSFGSLPLDYRAGDDPMAIADMVCQGVNGTSSDVETCLSTVPLFIKEAGLDPRLRYDTLCQAYVKAHGRRRRRNPPKADSKKRASSAKSSPAATMTKQQDGASASSQTLSGAKGSKPADSGFIEAAVNIVRQAQHVSEQEGSRVRPMVPLPVESEVEEEEETQAPIDGRADEDSGPDAASGGAAPVDDSLEKDSSRVLEYMRLGGVRLTLAYLHGQHGVDLGAPLWQPLDHSTHHAGVIAVYPSLNMLVYPNRSLEEVLHVDSARMEQLVPRVVRKCVALDGVTLRCLHSSAFSYNVWIKEAGTHTLEAWLEELGTGQRLAHSVTTATFTVQLSPEQASNPFFGHCAVPFTQRALMTGRLQRFIEDQGALNFDQEVSVPLTVLYRLSPRRDAPEHGLRTVTAATMSLINNLRLLSTPQRRLTTLRVYLNGFSAEVDEKWRRWLRKVCVPLGLSALVFSDDCPPGNMASYQHMKADALSLADPRAVVVLLEDDYLLQPSALQEMVEVFESHEPCVVIPYDGGERYAMNTFNDDDTHITVIAGRRRHWRTTRSTTVTFAARAGTLRVMDQLGVMMHPLDDYRNSKRLVAAGASIVMPLPGLAAHVESQQFAKEPWLPLYFNYIQYANKLMQQAYKEGLNLRD